MGVRVYEALLPLTSDGDTPRSSGSPLQKFAFSGGSLVHKFAITLRNCFIRASNYSAISSKMGRLLSTLLPIRCLWLWLNHIINKQQALDCCSWSNEKHILILNIIKENEYPMQVNLDYCDFFIHVHDLPLNMMNLGIATLLGNRIGVSRDMETDIMGCLLGSSFRIRVGLDVNQSLERVFKVHSTFGEELLANLTYERLPNFCYLCGKLGHIEKYYEGCFEEDFNDPGKETQYGLWLQAPLPSRGAQPREDTGAANSRSGSPTNGSPLEKHVRPVEIDMNENYYMQTVAQVGNLVNIPIEFTSYDIFHSRGPVRRGRPPVGNLNPQDAVTKKIQESRLELLKWNRAGFGNIHHRTQYLNKRICDLYQEEPNATNMAEIERIENVLEDLSSKEEVMWKQQAKALWLSEGDRNTSFSHVKANERRLHKEIQKIKNTQGQDVNDLEGIHKVIMDYFGSLFNSMRHSKESMERVLASMEKESQRL
ncbi:hypothetical protein Sango_2718700 [Sesamum angolense]|uniref:Zinc knuckle CX2CX4HX4C domain-containing protein n=1 Tax=Sesamum angolense TaxID=2727404 RepID=A0AAE1W398_9LAMI|nr:hypothetical protein Sango_2718700 [Sesamum angolense]